MKSRRLDNLESCHRGVSHAGLLGQKRGRRTQHRRQRAETPHECLGKRLGVTAAVPRIEKHLQQFQFAESLVSLVQQLGTHAALVPGHMVGRAVGSRRI